MSSSNPGKIPLFLRCTVAANPFGLRSRRPSDALSRGTRAHFLPRRCAFQHNGSLPFLSTIDDSPRDDYLRPIKFNEFPRTHERCLIGFINYACTVSCLWTEASLVEMQARSTGVRVARGCDRRLSAIAACCPPVSVPLAFRSSLCSTLFREIEIAYDGRERLKPDCSGAAMPSGGSAATVIRCTNTARAVLQRVPAFKIW